MFPLAMIIGLHQQRPNHKSFYDLRRVAGLSHHESTAWLVY